ncbi:MAG: MBL fold metallo-hydrolase [Archangiaceae bacterium]|nr:MBL fold metallo-hydrolase [Archangiaceae bacterium]
MPFLEAGGPANAYAIEDQGGGFTLFDCACGTDEGLAALREGLHQRGLTKLNRIVVSHGHVDHYGNAQTLAEESGAQVFVHRHDLEKLTGEHRWSNQLEKRWSYFLKLGVPDDTLHAMLERTRRGRDYARPVDRHRLQLLEEGQALRFAHFEAKVLHAPGHTPGLVCLHVPELKLLFADDHVLAKVSPNPLLDLSLGEGETKFKALVAYCASARRVQALELDCLLPGHGEAFKGHRELLEGLFQFYVARQGRISKRLEAGPATIYELVSAVFSRTDIGRLFLMLSEVLGNVEVLEEQGQVQRLEEGGVMRFRALGVSPRHDTSPAKPPVA